jgi:hypothetical protein
MAQRLDWSIWEAPIENDRELQQRGTADEDVPLPRRRSPDDDWESLWTDLGGEG